MCCLDPARGHRGFFATLQAASAHAAKKRNEVGRPDDEAAYTMAVEGVSLGVLAHQNAMSFQFRLKGGMKLDLPIPLQDAHNVRDMIDRVLEEADMTPGPKKN